MKTLLFIGDSVTDCGRRTDEQELGLGYVRVVAQQLAGDGAEAAVINRGISGNRVRDLLARWEPDCLTYNPDVVSILIGINDVWRGYDQNDPIKPDDFRRDYHELLRQLRERTHSRVILMEAFVLPIPDDRRVWRRELDGIINTTRELAHEFRTELIPFDGLLNARALERGLAAIAHDGVHPTALGHELMAGYWLEQYVRV